VAEHQERLVDFVEPDGGFALFKVAYKPKTQPGAKGKLDLGKPNSLAFFLYEGTDWIVHVSILYPIEVYFK